MLIHKTTLITLYNNLLTFRDTGKEFELKGDLLKKITNKNYNVALASLVDKNLMYYFAKEMRFVVITPINLLKSPGILISASGVSKTIFLSFDPDELCNRLTLLLQEEQVDNNSDIINEGIVVTLDKLLDYNCLSKKQHKQFLIKCNLLHEQV